MRLAVALVIVTCVISPAFAQALSPDEVTLRYLQNLYPSLEIRSTASSLDPYFCRAYGLLSDVTRAALPMQTFIAATRGSGYSATRIELGPPYVEGDRASVKVQYRAEHWLLGPIETIQTFFHLAREHGAWRMVISEENVQAFRRVAARQTRPVPLTVCD